MHFTHILVASSLALWSGLVAAHPEFKKMVKRTDANSHHDDSGNKGAEIGAKRDLNLLGNMMGELLGESSSFSITPTSSPASLFTPTASLSYNLHASQTPTSPVKKIVNLTTIPGYVHSPLIRF